MSSQSSCSGSWPCEPLPFSSEPLRYTFWRWNWWTTGSCRCVQYGKYDTSWATDRDALWEDSECVEEYPGTNNSKIFRGQNLLILKGVVTSTCPSLWLQQDHLSLLLCSNAWCQILILRSIWTSIHCLRVFRPLGCLRPKLCLNPWIILKICSFIYHARTRGSTGCLHHSTVPLHGREFWKLTWAPNTGCGGQTAMELLSRWFCQPWWASACEASGQNNCFINPLLTQWLASRFESWKENI